MICLFQGCILRFHVNTPGCTPLDGVRCNVFIHVSLDNLKRPHLTSVFVNIFSLHAYKDVSLDGSHFPCKPHHEKNVLSLKSVTLDVSLRVSLLNVVGVSGPQGPCFRTSPKRIRPSRSSGHLDDLLTNGRPKIDFLAGCQVCSNLMQFVGSGTISFSRIVVCFMFASARVPVRLKRKMWVCVTSLDVLLCFWGRFLTIYIYSVSNCFRLDEPLKRECWVLPTVAIHPWVWAYPKMVEVHQRCHQNEGWSF